MTTKVCQSCVRSVVNSRILNHLNTPRIEQKAVTVEEKKAPGLEATV